MASNKKQSLAIGLFLAASFLGVLFLIFSPVWGNGMNGLTYADDVFNKLSKGSSNFIPKLQKSVPPFNGRAFTTTVKLDKPEAAEKTADLFKAAGATAEVNGAELKIAGDLGQVLGAVVRDSDEMYQNNGAAVSGRYGYPEKDVLRNWWGALSKIDRDLKKSGKIEESKIVSDVMKRGVETAYNYYKIEAVQVKDKAVLMTSLLVFYVVYTMWWGFSIFFIFDAIGLTMSKAKVKKEV
jgi:hypothetical protein